MIGMPSTMRPSRLVGDVVQCCYVVADVEASALAWSRNFGAGPFFIVERFEGVRIRPNGEEAHTIVKVALGQCGGVQIELIQVLGGRSNVFDEVPLKGGGAFHHVAAFVGDMEAAIEDFARKGSPWWCRGDQNGMAVAFIDCRATLGFFVELYEAGKGMEAFYARIAAAAADWDGTTEPVRPRTALS